jgi:hypothetical protein
MADGITLADEQQAFLGLIVGERPQQAGLV